MNQYIINEYAIKETIGKGAFSKVKLGINKLTGEKVAIKILDKKAIKMNSLNKRIERELTILKKLNHINIIKIIIIKEDTDNIYIIMEYIENNLFYYILNNKYLSEQESSFYFFQLISGIDFIHSQGIVHRDLKPENILITKNKILKIIDFGLSNYYSNGKLLSTLCGSPSYTAPEVILGNKYDGFASDVWTMGIILYTMICGKLPFEECDNKKILFKKIIKCKIEYPKHISNNIKTLLQKILVANPDKRINIKEIKKTQFYLDGKKLFAQKFPELIHQIENKSKLNSGYSSKIKKVGPNFALLKKILKGTKIINKENQENNKNSNKDKNNSSEHLLNKLSKEKQIIQNKYLLTEENEKINNYNSGKRLINITNYNNNEKKDIKIEGLYRINIKRRNNKTSIMNSHSLNSKENNWSIHNYAETNNSINDYIYNNSELSIMNKIKSKQANYKLVNNSFSNRRIKNPFYNYNKKSHKPNSYKKRNLPIVNDKFRSINYPVQKNITKKNELYVSLLNKKKEEKKNLYFKILKLTKEKQKQKGKDIVNRNGRRRINNSIIGFNNYSTSHINRKDYIKNTYRQNKKRKKEDKYNIKEIIKRRGLDIIINKS